MTRAARITSYNVCYTKLLRLRGQPLLLMEQMQQFAGERLFGGGRVGCSHLVQIEGMHAGILHHGIGQPPGQQSRRLSAGRQQPGNRQQVEQRVEQGDAQRRVLLRNPQQQGDAIVEMAQGNRITSL